MSDLQAILLNRELGAQELLLKAIAWLQSHPESLIPKESAKTFGLLRTARPAMVGFSVLANRLEGELRRGAEAETVLKFFQDGLKNSTAAIAQNLYPKLQPLAPVSILTPSYSSTLREVLLNVSDLVGEIHVLESEPGGEGKRLARVLKKELLDVKCHPDHELDTWVGKCGLGLIGADTVFPDGSVLNKVLSNTLAAVLREAEKPLYVLASRWKRASEMFSIHLMAEEDRRILERVPSTLITEIISD